LLTHLQLHVLFVTDQLTFWFVVAMLGHLLDHLLVVSKKKEAIEMAIMAIVGILTCGLFAGFLPI